MIEAITNLNLHINRRLDFSPSLVFSESLTLHLISDIKLDRDPTTSCRTETIKSANTANRTSVKVLTGPTDVIPCAVVVVLLAKLSGGIEVV